MKNQVAALITWIFLISKVALGQENDASTYVPPSPDAAALLKYASVPVNLYSGLPEINIPLVELKSRVGTIPISLSYHASGIKVQDIASSVGLGWSLNAGGAVTRVVRGLPDEGPNGYLNVTFSQTIDDYNNLLSNNKDTEPDVFYFNFLGNTGTFILGPNGLPLPLPERDLKISKPDFTITDTKFEIIDLQGITFVFGKTSNSRETTTTKLKNEPASKARTYISTWYLSEIIFPTGKDLVSFTYTTGTQIYYEYYRQYEGIQQPGQRLITSCGGVSYLLYPFTVTDQITEVTVPAPKNISTISTTLGTATFNYQADRLDLANAKRLSSVVVLNYLGNQVRNYEINNNFYFDNATCSSGCKRLKLKSIIERTNGAVIEHSQFAYDETENLPLRNSIQYDHWGFYNNNSYSSAIAAVTDYLGNYYPGANKDPLLSRTQANTLIKITNATGGSTELEYQLNECFQSPSNVKAGGLRVSRIIESPKEGNIIIKDYKYQSFSNPTQSSGIKYRGNRYHFVQKNYSSCSYNNVDYVYGNSIVVRYSTSLVDQFDIGGISVGYSNASIVYSNGAQERFTFTDFNQRPDDPAQLYYPSDVANNEDFNSPDGPPFVSRGDRSYERGLLKEQLYLGSDGKKKKRIENLYEFYIVSGTTIQGGKNTLLWQNKACSNCAPILWTKKGIYTYFHRGVRLQTKTEELYDQNDETKFVSTTTDNTYNSRYSTLLNTSITNHGESGYSKVSYLYPYDLYTGAVSSTSETMNYGNHLLIQKNIVGRPVVVTQSVKRPNETDYRITNSEFTAYQNNSKTSNPVPYRKYLLKLGTPFDPYALPSITNAVLSKDIRYYFTEEYIEYDDFDNLTNEVNSRGINYLYTWDYNNSLIKSITKNPLSVPEILTYEHKPMVGITKITDANNIDTYYEYDKLNRLKIIKDHDGNITKQIRYGFTNENGFTASLSSSSSCARTNTTLNFSGSITATEYGQTNYEWNFADGATATTSTPLTTHAFTAPGNYMVKIKAVNPEYGNAEAGKNIQICLPLSVSICADGPTMIDLCGPTVMANGTCTTATRTNPIFKATLNGGCTDGFTYRWEYQIGTGGWNFLSSSVTCNAPVEFSNRTINNYNVRCIITDACGSITSNQYYLTIFKSCP
jgi:YD repeat-containing protein